MSALCVLASFPVPLSARSAKNPGYCDSNITVSWRRVALGLTEKAKRSGSGKFGLRLVLLSALRLLFGDGVVWLLSLLFRFLLSSFVGPFVLLAVADGVTTYRNARRCDGRCEEAPACASALAGACARPCAAATCRARAPAAQSARFLCLLLSFVFAHPPTLGKAGLVDPCRPCVS